MSVFIHDSESNPPVSVTIFGGSGFIGRALTQALARAGWRVRIATRDIVRSGQMRTFGAVGQVVPVACNIRSDESVRAAIGDSAAVINLLGILYEKGGNRFDAIHHEAAARIAKAAAAAGATRLMHMSSLGANAESDSAYARSKAAGEAAAKAAFPDVTIFRPAALFGPGDGLFTRFAGLARNMPFLPLFGGGGSKMQPVYLGDVVAAFMAALADPKTKGLTYELAGPRPVTLHEMYALTLHFTGRHKPMIPVPFAIAKIKAAFLQLLPKPPLTVDQLKLLATDNVPSGTLPGLAALGIAPTPIEAILPQYLDRFQVGGRFAKRRTRPVEEAES